jgi:hypothetical protein
MSEGVLSKFASIAVTGASPTNLMFATGAL